MAFRLLVNPDILERFPNYRVAIIYASGLKNTASTEESTGWLREAERESRERFGQDPLKEHPHIRLWQEAFSSFGAKPSKYPSSVEALLKRVVADKELPSINALVDAYNALSIKHVIPIGGEDRDRLLSDLELRFMSGTETFDTVNAGQPVVENAAPGEVAWVDAGGVTCRRWNWRQCRRTALTTDTVNAYFVLDHLAPYPEEALEAAAAELESRILHLCPNAGVTREMLGR
ncbi:MAG TPA: phenylalanine--tRNA ligase beta subunit-related protein [Bryobacteraceae bacterium]|nr:phenylalanine--tRNA ligase beta subunit-related protein [Bryobacteraceae bacterium]